MIRVFYILHKKPGMSDDAFREYWRATHGPIAAKVPGLLKYIQSYPYPDPYGAALPADGVAEFEFESMAAMQDGLASPEGRAMLADVANFADGATSGPIVIGAEDKLV